MGSFRAILRHEGRRLRGSAAGRWVAVLLAVLTVYGLCAGLAAAERQRRMQDHLLQQQEETIAAHLEVLRRSVPGGTHEEIQAAVARRGDRPRGVRRHRLFSPRPARPTRGRWWCCRRPPWPHSPWGKAICCRACPALRR